jgi:hypothetical protein
MAIPATYDRWFIRAVTEALHLSRSGDPLKHFPDTAACFLLDLGPAVDPPDTAEEVMSR